MFDRLVGADPHAGTVFDFYVTFDEEDTSVAGKARWGELPTAAPIDSDDGQDLLKRGCEATVLKGGSPGGNKYRLGVRTAVLLGEKNARNWSSERIGEFFRTLYEYRNEVVHKDTTLPDEPSGDDWISVEHEEFLANTFLIRARELYADIILEYLDLFASQDASIQNANEQIDKHTLEYGPEIREQLF